MGFDVPQIKVKVDVDGKTYKLDFQDVGDKLLIDPVHIDEELEKQAAFFFWVATLASAAEHNAEEEKQLFDIWFSEKQRDVRQEMESGGGKAPAAATVEATAKSTEEYSNRLEEVLEAKRIASLLGTVREAVRMRQYILIERSRRISKLEAAETEE